MGRGADGRAGLSLLVRIQHGRVARSPCSLSYYARWLGANCSRRGGVNMNQRVRRGWRGLQEVSRAYRSLGARRHPGASHPSHFFLGGGGGDVGSFCLDWTCLVYVDAGGR